MLLEQTDRCPRSSRAGLSAHNNVLRESKVDEVCMGEQACWDLSRSVIVELMDFCCSSCEGLLTAGLR